MDWILQPWPWYIAGPLISLTMFSLVYFGKNFGMSNNLRTMCAIGGGGNVADFFKFDWKGQIWNLIFAIGTIVGGFLASTYLMADQEIILNPETVNSLESLGFSEPGKSYLPKEIFSLERLSSIGGLLLLLSAGFMVGFGARYAGGCTSGHAISGLSDLQIPSLIAVVGFFIGGLIMVHLILPLIF